MINVTKPYLPSRARYDSYIDKIYKSNWLTNNGELTRLLESRLCDYLGVKNLVLVANGGMALHLAYKLFGITGEVITTPFSYVATTSTLLWDGITPVHSDIDSSLNLDPKLIEEKITAKTSAILPVHTFGNPCDIDALSRISKQHNLKLVYDAAHCFGSTYQNSSILNRGDASIISFHATKLFHTIEGGAIILNSDEDYLKAQQMRTYGFEDGEIKGLGINGRMNEFSAAMGLAVLDELEQIMEQRKIIWQLYYENFKNLFDLQPRCANSNNNYHYMPVIFKNSEQRHRVNNSLNQHNIFPRRYFHPSLDTLEYMQGKNPCPVSQDVASRILCMPIYPGLKEAKQKEIIKIVIESA